MKTHLVAALLVSLGVASAYCQESEPRWHCWTFGEATARDVNEKAAWFVAAGAVRRYDLVSRNVRTWTVLDGLPMESETDLEVRANADGACLLRLGRRLFLNPREQGWKALPALPVSGNFHIGLGPSDEVCTITHDGFIRELVDGKWKQVGQVTGGGERLWPVDGGFIVGYVTRHTGPGRVRSSTAWIDREEGTQWFFELPSGLIGECPSSVFRDAGKWHLIIGNQTGPPVCMRLEDGRLVDSPNAAGHAPQARLLASRKAGTRPMMGIVPPPDLLPPIYLEGRGDLLDRRQYDYDPASGEWKFLLKDVPPAYRSVDPQKRLHWSLGMEGQRQVLQCYQLDESWKRTRVVRTVQETAHLWGGLAFEDEAGQWWGAGTIHENGRDRYVACRLDKNGVQHFYDVERGIDGNYRPQIQRAANGNIWVWSETSSRHYDAEKDRFVVAEPWEDFAFRFGPWELSMAGAISSRGQQVYRKTGGHWEPLVNPFGAGELRGTATMIHGDRMLLSAPPLGVVEYDAANDRWIVLHEIGRFRAGFTGQGQRVMIGRGNVLMFQGDPFDCAPEIDKQSREFSQLLRLMDHPKWRVRQDATEKLKELYPNLRSRIGQAQQDERLSPEVRMRVAAIIQMMSSNAEVRIPGLLYRMHPPLGAEMPTTQADQ